MVTIRLTNSKTRKKDDFVPLDPGNVRMYVCGPTVYDRAHLGNARPVVVFDVLNRLLRQIYGDKNVTYVRNFTDVDDKINAEALRRQKAGAPGTLEELIHQRTAETIAWYHADMDALGAARPDHEPRATGFIAQMVAMTADLIAKGHAYAVEGHVLFRVRSYKDYGKLSGRSVDDMIAGARVEVAPFKEDPMDFVLWKPSTDQEPGWESPWGRGRPGWHIECSAMAQELLGDSFDIHGGGLDLQFPHHENEIAQSACAHPEGSFARYWLHNEMLQVEGKKMSKSLGNFFTVRDLLDQGVPGEVIRYVLLMTHYRKPMDWTTEKVKEAERTLRKWWGQVEGASSDCLPSPEIMEALADDLNTPAAISELHRVASLGNPRLLKSSAELVGLLREDLGEWARKKIVVSSPKADMGFDPRLVYETMRFEAMRDIAAELSFLISVRQQARRDRNFQFADQLRDELLRMGLDFQDQDSFTVATARADTDFDTLEEVFRRELLRLNSEKPQDGEALQ
jgi:cysteinyl-tRNA synthetase